MADLGKAVRIILAQVPSPAERDDDERVEAAPAASTAVKR